MKDCNWSLIEATDYGQIQHQLCPEDNIWCHVRSSQEQAGLNQIHVMDTTWSDEEDGSMKDPTFCLIYN